MRLTRSAAILHKILWCDEVESTNAELARLIERLVAAGDKPETGLCVATLNQTGGRGRRGRAWTAASGDTLAFSLLVRVPNPAAPQQPDRDQLLKPAPTLGVGWLPLMVGVAVVEMLREFIPASRLGVKWPNDVLVVNGAEAESQKISGILCEVAAEDSGELVVIVGVGVNLFASTDRLPVPTATSAYIEANRSERSLRADWAGAAADLVDRALAGVTRHLFELLATAKSDADEVRQRVVRESVTLGEPVNVHLPDGTVASGMATGLAEDGALIVSREDNETLVVSAGDVEHLR